MAETTFHSITLPGANPARVPLTAVEFSTSTAYKVRDYCTYQGKLYICSTAHAAGAWNAAHFTEVNVGDEINTRLVVPPTTEPASTDRRVGDLWIDTNTESPVISIDPQPVAGSTNVPQSGGTFNLIKNLDNNKAGKSLLTGDFSTSSPYSVNDLCIHDGYLYRCIVDIPTGAAWNASKWQATTIETELARIESEGVDLDVIAETFGASSSYVVGDYVLHTTNGVDKLYKCTSAVSDTSVWNSQYWSEVKLADEVSDLKSAISDSDGDLILSSELQDVESYLDNAVYNRSYINIGELVENQSFPLGWRIGRFMDDGSYVNQYDGMRTPNAFAINEDNEVFLTVPNNLNINYIIEYNGRTISLNNFSRIIFNSTNAHIASFFPVRGKYYAFGIKGLPNFTDFYNDSDFVNNIKLFTRESKIPDKSTYFNEKIVFLPFIEENNKFLSNTGIIEDAGSTQYNIATCSVSEGDILIVSGSNTYYNAICSFFDSNMDLISVGAFATTGTSTITNVEALKVVAPPTAAYIVVNYMRKGIYASVKKVTGTKIKGAFIGKKWCCIGDSLTEKNTATSIHYYDYVEEITDIIPVVMGVGGSGYARKADMDQAFYQRAANIPLDSDIITIFGSFNDLGAGLELGNENDSGTNSLAGCVNTTIDTIQSLIPLANIGIVSPTPWDTTRPTISGNAFNYVEMLKSICTRRSIPFLDLWRSSNLHPWDTTFRTVAYSKDNGSGTHPDENGHKLIASHFMSFLNSLLLY